MNTSPKGLVFKHIFYHSQAHFKKNMPQCHYDIKYFMLFCHIIKT
jgi:hypothetical protein